jgi:plasmid maintenance system killer protein
MKRQVTERFRKSFRSAPPEVKKAFNKQAKLLFENLHHSSLHAKKYDESSDLWQARVNRDWRFYFLIVGDTYLITDIIPHPK